MKKLCGILLIVLANCASTDVSEQKSVLMLSDSDLIRLISSLSVDPRLELPLHIIIEERTKAIMILQICQSSHSSRKDFSSKLKHNGRDIFVYDFAGRSDKDRVIYFNQDAPSWKVAVFQNMGLIQFFNMEEIHLPEN